MEAKKLNIPEAPKATFMQQPYWGAQDQIKLNGADFEMLYNFVNSFGPAVDAARRVMQDNINVGIIKIRNVDENGQEVPEELVKKYFEYLNNWQNQIKNMHSVVVPTEPESQQVSESNTESFAESIVASESEQTGKSESGPIEANSDVDAIRPGPEFSV